MLPSSLLGLGPPMLGDDADHLTASGEGRIRHRPHQPDAATAGDDAQPAAGQVAAEGPGSGGVLRAGTGA